MAAVLMDNVDFNLNADHNHVISELIVPNPPATYFGLASGDSMQGVGIFDGDLLVVDRSVTPKHGDIVVATFNSQFVCKVFDENERMLKSANPTYKDKQITELDHCTLEGVVTSSIRMHRRVKFN